VPAWWRAPSFPLAVALLAAPAAAVLQSKAMAPVALVALALSVVAARRASGRWPWPHGAALVAALALALWGLASAAWAVEPRRALETAAGLGAMLLLGAAAAAGVAAEDAGPRRRLAFAAAAGLGIGLAAACFDWLSGSLLRAAVRGIAEPSAMLALGLKPAASVMALLLPLLAALPAPPRLRLAALIGGALLLLVLPGDTPKLAALAGLGASGLAALAPRRGPVALGALLGLGLLAAPVVLGTAFHAGTPAERLPPSAAHRLLIWDFALLRIAERPNLGWGMEASRALPGGTAGPSEAQLLRFGLTSPGSRAWFGRPEVQVMPLHPHNGALQLRIELGWPGALLGAALLLLLGVAAARAPCPAAAAGVLASAAVTGLLSFGLWQAWWIAAELLALATLAALPRAHPPGNGLSRG
jgi:O-antigen ligase